MMDLSLFQNQCNHQVSSSDNCMMMSSTSSTSSTITNHLLSSSSSSSSSQWGDPNYTSSIGIFLLALGASEFVVYLVCRWMAYYANNAFYSQSLEWIHSDTTTTTTTASSTTRSTTSNSASNTDGSSSSNYDGSGGGGGGTLSSLVTDNDTDQIYEALHITKLSSSSSSKSTMPFPWTTELNESSCPICLIDYEPNDSIARGKCHHAFHEECLVRWLSRHSSCPCCREILLNSHESDLKRQQQQQQQHYYNFFSDDDIVMNSNNHDNEATSTTTTTTAPTATAVVGLPYPIQIPRWWLTYPYQEASPNDPAFFMFMF